MHANRRTRDTCTETKPLGLVRDRADHAPYERALALLIDPGMEVIGDQREVEAALLRPLREANEIVGRMLFTRERVTDLGQWLALPPFRPAAFFWAVVPP
jgi:hypothetical protein